MPDDVEIVKGFAIRMLEQSLARPVVALKRIGALVTSRSIQRFNLQKGPDDRPWLPPMTPNVPAILMDLDQGTTVKSSRFEQGPALQDTGRLWGSINWRLVSGDTVEIGTNVLYAKFHQFGLDRVVPVTQRQKVNLQTFLSTSFGQQWAGHLSWLYKVDQFMVQTIARPFIGVSIQDMADIRELIRKNVISYGQE